MTMSSSNQEPCPCCPKRHLLWDCSTFARKSLNARLQFMREKRLCDNCAKRGHISKFCYGKSRCTKSNCTLEHHTLVHQEPSGSTNTNKPSNCKIPSKSAGTSTERNSGPSEVCNYSTTAFNSSDVYLKVIPVRVSAGNKSVLTYAFLDQGSTATLCDKRLLNQLVLGVLGFGRKD